MAAPDTIQVFVPLKLRKKNGRPKILPPADYLPSEDNTQDPHILRAIGRAWAWRRRMEAGEFGTVRDLAIAVNLAERHVSRQLRLAYLAPEVLKRLVFRREVSAVTVMQLSECAAMLWQEQAGVVFREVERGCMEKRQADDLTVDLEVLEMTELDHAGTRASARSRLKQSSSNMAPGS
jgi:hypothetical protein